MAENIGGNDLFSSGGHVWHWTAHEQSANVLQTVGTVGAARMVLGDGPKVAMIAGRSAGGMQLAPAVLKAEGDSKAAADTAMDALEDAIEAERKAGEPCSWEDDAGHTGDYLVVTGYEPLGPREYGREGDDWRCWQRYRATVMDLSGGTG
ncbi:MAG TPA: hypothetical protein VMY35_01745 [Phycisphaerae bacterium]|nr:hypothetical protein [Phycisphaerae bacterium]